MAVPDPQALLLGGGLEQPLRVTAWRCQELALLLKQIETESYLFRIRVYLFLHPLNTRTPVEKSNRKLHSQ